MAGPWERFSAQPSAAPASGPWERFAAPAQTEYVQPAPPPGEIIHGSDRSYISDNPAVNTARPADGNERAMGATMEALNVRADNDGTAAAAARVGAPYLQGYTFGGSDEILSAVMAGANALQGGSLDDGYDIAQELQRQELDRMRTEHPIASTALQVGGGVQSGVQLARNGVTLLGRMPYQGIRNLLPRMAAGGVEGGAYAGLSGFLGADGDTGDRVDQAVENLPMGIGLGAAAVPVVDLISAIMQPAMNAYRGLTDPIGRADDIVVTRMAADQQTPDDIARAVEEAAASGQTEFRAVDAAPTGGNLQRAGAMAAKTPGEARPRIRDTMHGRQEGQATRIGGYLDDALGPGNSAYATEQNLIAGRKAAAGPLYDAAYANPPPAGQFYDDMLQRQSVQEAIAGAEVVAAERQVPVTELFTDVVTPTGETRRIPTVRGWDFIKKELDAKVNQLFAANDTTRATAVKETRNALREQLGNDVPEYGQALREYADDSTSLDALQAGRDLITAGNADEVTDLIGGFTGGDRDLARVGAARELVGRVNKPDYSRDGTRVFSSPEMQSRLNTVIDDPLTRAIFDTRIGRERDMVNTKNTLLGGSNTVENMVDGAELSNSGGALAALLNGQPLRALGLAGGQAMGAIGRAASGMTDRTASRVADRLLTNDPAAIRSLADLFVEAQQRATAPRIAPVGISSGFNAPRSGSDR